MNKSVNPFSEDYYSYRCTRILQLFVQMNLSLVSARHCKVKAFFRRPPVETPLPEGSLHSSSIVVARNTQPSASSIGYSFEKGVHHGFVHWIRNISISAEKSDKSTAGDVCKENTYNININDILIFICIMLYFVYIRVELLLQFFRTTTMLVGD